MGKKKKGQATHAQNAFYDLVGKANQNALKPYINQVMSQIGNELSGRVFAKLGIFQNRIEAIERVLAKKLGITSEEIYSELFDLEDEVTGHVKVDRPAQAGDLLRVTMRAREIGKDFGKASKREFANLTNPPYALGVKDLEDALVGVSTGETKVVPLEGELQKATNVDAIEFVVDRISEKVQVKKEEATNADSKDASQPSGGQEAGEAQPS